MATPTTLSHAHATPATAATTTAPEPLPEPGDIILYRAQPGAPWPGNLIDAAIVAGTSEGDPRACYVHCGVVERVERAADGGVAQITTIEALSQRGVTRVTFPLYPAPDADTTPAPFMFAHIACELEPLRIAHGLAWLGRMVGARYGWLDIAADVARALLPRRLGSRTPFLVAPSRFDCSDVTCRYLLLAGYEWLPDAAVSAPSWQSPNDIARMLGVIE